MVILIFDKQLVDDCITGLPIGDPLDMQWPHHFAHQKQSGSLEKTPCLQQQFGVATQTNQDAVDNSGMPPYLRRKPTRHDDRATRTSCKASGGTTSMLGGAMSDDGDWMQSDHSDEDELQQLEGAGRIGEYPPRIRWLRKRHLRTLKMAVKCAQPQIRDPPRSRKRNGGGTAYHISKNNESESKRRRYSSSSISDIQQVEESLILGGGLPANMDRAGVVVSCREVTAALPVTGHFSDLGPRRSQRLREKLGSACG